MCGVTYFVEGSKQVRLDRARRYEQWDEDGSRGASAAERGGVEGKAFEDRDEFSEFPNKRRERTSKVSERRKISNQVSGWWPFMLHISCPT